MEQGCVPGPVSPNSWASSRAPFLFPPPRVGHEGVAFSQGSGEKPPLDERGRERGPPLASRPVPFSLRDVDLIVPRPPAFPLLHASQEATRILFLDVRKNKCLFPGEEKKLQPDKRVAAFPPIVWMINGLCFLSGDEKMLRWNGKCDPSFSVPSAEQRRRVLFLQALLGLRAEIFFSFRQGVLSLLPCVWVKERPRLSFLSPFCVEWDCRYYPSLPGWREYRTGIVFPFPM